MNTLTFTPDEFNKAADEILKNYAHQIITHMPCICKKKVHKNCPKHLASGVTKMLYDYRQPLGDKLLYLQLKKAPKGDGTIDIFETEPRKILPIEECYVSIKDGESFNTNE